MKTSLLKNYRNILHRATCILLRPVLKRCIPFVKIGKRTYIENNVELDTISGGHIEIGNKCELHSGCKILTYGGTIKIGNNCSINPYTILYGQGNLTIGNCVRIAAHCVIIPSNHNFDKTECAIMHQGLTNKGITIEDDVWLGCGVRVLDGVTIRKGCVIGAGSVVTHSTEPFGVYVGCPARKIKCRGTY